MSERYISFGAIRWDAWYTHNGREDSVVTQVEKSLGPAKYHFRAPFFARVTETGGIEIPYYDQTLFDREMEYAIDAGVDYFAYVWYGDEMSAARKFHTQSKYREQVKLCPCFDGNAIGHEYAHKEMEELLKQPYFMRVCGRPLMYYFGHARNQERIKEEIAFYKDMAKRIGEPEPYAVLMGGNAESLAYTGADAASRYAVGGSNGMPFRQLMESAATVWERLRGDNLPMIPNVTAGWHTVTRYENPVRWMNVPETSWAQYATGEELTEHVAQGLRFVRENPDLTPADTLLIYAWNEHDEGGWICPTIAVDDEGRQLFDKNGEPIVNDEHLQAVKRALRTR